MNTIQLLESLEAHYDSALPFVAYRKPKSNRLRAFMQNSNEVFTTKNYSESGFVFAPFDDSENSVLIPLENAEFLECVDDNNYQSLKSQDSDKYSSYKDEKNELQQRHINLVEKGIKYIHKQQFKKVVLSRCEVVDNLGANPFSIFKRLLQLYTNAFVYCWYHPKVGLWFGATPETLLTINGSRLQTMALAGTQVYKGSLNVEWGAKEEEEQQFVTDFIMNSLQSSVDSLLCSEVRTIKAGNLLHLKTGISAQLKQGASDLKHIIEALHPTPAVCGLPKASAKDFILKNENYKREFYTGFLGELNIKETQSRNTNRRNVENNVYRCVKTVSNLFVNLRCMQLKANVASIYVGGGITKESNPKFEWEETQKKAQTMLSALK